MGRLPSCSHWPPNTASKPSLELSGAAFQDFATCPVTPQHARLRPPNALPPMIIWLRTQSTSGWDRYFESARPFTRPPRRIALRMSGQILQFMPEM